MTYIITESCIDIKDKACMDECPVDCIYEGGRMLYINPEECIDCGACEPVCPNDAIVFDKNAKPEQLPFIEINKEFFNDIGNIGGSSLIDVSDKDHDSIKKMQIKKQ
jgi:ferredoxin